MKPFHEWVSQHANSIDDPNIIKKTENTIIPTTPKTSISTRADFANLLVKDVVTSSDAACWMQIFTLSELSTLSTSVHACCHKLELVMGKTKADSYVNADYTKKALWVNDFRQLIASGWTPGENTIDN